MSDTDLALLGPDLYRKLKAAEDKMKEMNPVPILCPYCGWKLKLRYTKLQGLTSEKCTRCKRIIPMDLADFRYRTA